jgi:GT2 family glycosyltransferase
VAGIGDLGDAPFGDGDRALTDVLAVPEIARRVSALIVTYNRCPFDPMARGRDNPLTWALDTLLAQAAGALREIVIVDDGSTDHTPTVIERYTAADTPVPVISLRNERRRGATVARNAAIAAATGELLLFGDDDCIFRPNYAAGAAYVLDRLRHSDRAACGVTLPFYYRALQPRERVPIDEIGLLDIDTARFSTRFHAYPTEYGTHPPLLDHRTRLLAPFPVQLVSGTCLLDAAAVRGIGGFADLAAWRTSYSDHLTLAAELTDAGKRLYHCPDPRLSAPHLKFGAKGRFALAEQDLATSIVSLDRPFGELVQLAAMPRTDTGCRTDHWEFFIDMIGSFFAFFAERSRAGAHAWATRVYREFVAAGIVHSLSIDRTPGCGERRELWRIGLRKGARLAARRLPRAGPGAPYQALLDDITRSLGEARIHSR